MYLTSIYPGYFFAIMDVQFSVKIDYQCIYYLYYQYLLPDWLFYVSRTKVFTIMRQVKNKFPALTSLKQLVREDLVEKIFWQMLLDY